MNSSLLEQLHDIEGLDAISLWPLAVGWWVVIALLCLIICTAIYIVVSKIVYHRSWKKQTLQKLNLLELSLSEKTARENLITLSEYLRRIALRRFPRKECAGLTEECWLEWLTDHDPKKFDWKLKGGLLLKMPYAPLSAHIDVAQVKDLIHAVKYWVI